MDCSVCFGDLMEDPPPPPASSPPKKKKSKMDNTKSLTCEHCCLPCGHIFHKQCIISWFDKQYPNQRSTSKHGTCPTCRKKADEKQFYPAYFSPSTQKQPETKKENSESAPSASSPPVTLFPNPNGFKSPNIANNPFSTGISDSTKSDSSCKNEDCCDLQMRFKLLEQDYQEAMQKWQQEKEKANCYEAVINSLLKPTSEQGTKENTANTSEGTGSNSEFTERRSDNVSESDVESESDYNYSSDDEDDF